MRRSILSIFIIISGLTFVNAQKIGHIDSEFILSKMPEYKKAQDEIDQLSAAWEKDVAEMQRKVTGLYTAYQAEQVLLTEEMKKDRLDEITKKEEELKDYQKQHFGFGGLYFLKKQELIKPLQEKLFEAVDKVSKANRLAYVFDKAGEMVIIYSDPRHDYSDFVLEELGLGDPNDQIK